MDGMDDRVGADGRVDARMREAYGTMRVEGREVGVSEGWVWVEREDRG